ncbi:MAG: class I SAM-dependent methyltransferase [Acidobacteriota bacterium]
MTPSLATPIAPSTSRQDPHVAVPCALCGIHVPGQEIELYPALAPSRSVSPVFAASTGVRGTTRIVRCRECDLVYVNPRLADGAILDAYRQSVDPLYVCQADPRRRSFERNVRMVHRYAAPGRLLDVGCAAGYFLDAAQKAGWDAYGLDPNRDFIARAQERHGLAVFEGTLATVPLEAGSFDVITMWDVLEHTTDPRAELRRAYALLRTGGLLFVNFPNIGSLLARLSGSSWWFLLSHHLYYFTPATLTRILEGEGFGVIARSRYWQTLELGYLAGMARLYSEGAARGCERILSATGLARRRLSYYAGQMTLVAAK